jgi:hypothetical protein
MIPIDNCDLCFWCGRYCFIGGGASRDHVQPAAFGGTTSPKNIVTAWRDCNGDRGRLVSYHVRVVKAKLAVFKVKQGKEKPAEVLAFLYRLLAAREAVRTLAKKWRAIEEAKLGRYISLELGGSLPALITEVKAILDNEPYLRSRR